MLARLERTQARRHSVQGMISGVFMAVIVVLVALLSVFNIVALGRLEKRTEDLRADLQVNQRLEAIASANAVARSTKELADDMRDLRRAARDEIEKHGLSVEQARAAADEARLYLLGSVQRVTVQTRTIAQLSDRGRVLAHLDKGEQALLSALRALRAFDDESAAGIGAGQAQASFEQIAAQNAELKTAVEKMAALDAFGGKSAEAGRGGLAQLYFLVAQRLNYRADLCAKVAELAAGLKQAQPYPLRVEINNGDCLRKMGKIADANAEFNQAVDAYEKSEQRGIQRTPEFNYRALRGRATTAIALPDTKDKAADKARFQQAIKDLETAAGFSKANGETAAQQQGTLENIGFAYLRLGDVKGAIEHTQKVDQINPMAWNLTVQAIAAKAAGDRALEQSAREKLRAFRRSQFNECEVRRLLGPKAGELDTILQSARDADVTPGACPGG